MNAYSDLGQKIDVKPAFARGDRVTAPDGAGIGTIKNAGSVNALVAWADGTDRLHPLGQLTRAKVAKRQPPKAPLRFLSYDDMVNLPDPQWLIEGVIMEETSALMFGKSNSFKSFLAIDMACSVATGDLGKGWHGARIFDGYPVLYVATEGALGVAKQRIPGWMEAHEVPMGYRQSVALYPQEIALDDDKSVNDLIRSCAIWTDEDGSENWSDPAYAFKLIVLDIFGATMMGPETSDETARAWVRNINRIIREVKCAVLTVAHTGWADETRARMHTHFWGSFDTRLKAEGDKKALTTVLTVDRHKDADSAGEWGFQLEKVTLSTGQTTLVPRLCDEVEAKGKQPRLTGKQNIALQALSEALIEQGKTISGPNYPACPVVAVEAWRAMCDRHGLTDSEDTQTRGRTFRRARDELHEKGLVRIFDGHVWKADQ